MKCRASGIAGLLAATLLSLPAAGATPGLQPVFSSDLVINGAATTDDDRLFLPVQPTSPGAGPEVVEVRNNKPVPFPDGRWNGWRPGMDGSDRFVGVNAIRIGPDGSLWIVDRGSPGIGAKPVPHGVKLVRIDLRTNSVTRVIPLDGMTRPWSFVDDVRFNGGNAYLTDAGAPALIVLDLRTGTGRRVLEGHPATVAQSPLRAEGRVLLDKNGDPVNIHADQLELSPDGRWLFFQPCSGRLSRIETRWLDDPSLGDAALGAHVERFTDTPSTGGTAIDDQGTLYLSDTDRSRILAIAPDGGIRTLVSDPRLAWVDAMWIDRNGNLLLPASQLDRTAGLDGGKDTVQRPIVLYRLPIGRSARTLPGRK